MVTKEERLTLFASIYSRTLMQGGDFSTKHTRKYDDICKRYEKKFHKEHGRKKYMTIVSQADKVWQTVKNKRGQTYVDVEPMLIELYFGWGELIDAPYVIDKIAKDYIKNQQDDVEVISSNIVTEIMETTYKVLGYKEKEKPSWINQ